MSADGLTPAEEALWLLQGLVPGSGVSNVALSVRMPGPVSPETLDTALRFTARRHEALRASFPMSAEGLPIRRVAGGSKLPLSVRKLDPATIDEDLRSFAAAPFDLTVAPLLRTALFQSDVDEPIICLAAHHIVIDATSLRVLVDELTAVLAGLVTCGEPPAVLAEVAAAPRRELVPAEKSVEYWRSQFAALDGGAQSLSAARDLSAEPVFACGEVEHRFSAEVTSALARLRKACRATDHMVLLAAYQVLLVHHGGAPDGAIGAMVSTRRAADDDTVGYQAHLLPVRVVLHPAMTFAEVVAAARAAMIGAVAHADVPYEFLVHRGIVSTGDRSSWWRPQLFRHTFNLRHDSAAEGGTSPRPLYVEVGTGLSRFELELSLDYVEGGLRARLDYHEHLYDAQFGSALLVRLEQLLLLVAESPGVRLGELDIRSDQDREIVRRSNDTARQWGGARTLLDQIRERAGAAPDAVVICEGDRRVTYRELIGAAEAVRRSLVEAGVTSGDVVGLCGDRGTGVAAAVLGTWAAGAAYLPVDGAQPAFRISHQLDETRCRVLVDAGSLPAECLRGRVHIRTDGDSVGDLSAVAQQPEDQAYVMYTSGSTGRPKGVRLTHGNLVNVVAHFADLIGFGEQDAFLWLTGFTFDISALELLLPIAFGGRVVVAPDQARSSPELLLEVLADNNVTVVQATPTTWRLVAPVVTRELGDVTVLCGGEPLSADLARVLLAAAGRLFNVYGPTETTIWSTAAEITRLDSLPPSVGTPIANTVVDVMDADGRPLPVGVPGELCIGGVGVALGYVGDPVLTGDRFRTGRTMRRYYRTGDIAAWRFDGTLGVLGRRDRQVKINGHRVELGEVESVLEKHATVGVAAVVHHRGGDAVDRITAFVQPLPCQGSDTSGYVELLWAHTRDWLPHYSLPSHIVPVERLPVTRNDKVDYPALAERAARVDATGPVNDSVPAAADADDVLEVLLDVWQEVLRVDQVRPGTNFFLSGGSSLLAAVLVSKIGKRLGLSLTMAAMFANPTPATLAAVVRRLR